jgi:hypothetical protein
LIRHCLTAKLGTLGPERRWLMPNALSRLLQADKDQVTNNDKGGVISCRCYAVFHTVMSCSNFSFSHF